MLLLSMISLSTFVQAQSCNSQYLKHNYRFTPPSITTEPYDLSLAIDSTDNGQNILVAIMVLGDYSYFVSPYSADKAKGAFSISFYDNMHANMDSVYTEIPQSIASEDLHSGGMTHFVNNNTVYLKNIRVKRHRTSKSLDLSGLSLSQRAYSKRLNLY